MSAWGIDIIVSPALPADPTPGEWARRYVRHGMADVLEWLGEKVGPEPDQPTHAYMATNGTRDVLFASAEFVADLKVGVQGANFAADVEQWLGEQVRG
jgi:hypothetical protein